MRERFDSLSSTITVAGGRGQPKPVKLKRVAKLSKQEVCGCACGGHATAMITRDGKLYMFGSLEEDVVDKSSGKYLIKEMYYTVIQWNFTIRSPL